MVDRRRRTGGLLGKLLGGTRRSLAPRHESDRSAPVDASQNPSVAQWLPVGLASIISDERFTPSPESKPVSLAEREPTFAGNEDKLVSMPPAGSGASRSSDQSMSSRWLPHARVPAENLDRPPTPTAAPERPPTPTAAPERPPTRAEAPDAPPATAPSHSLVRTSFAGSRFVPFDPTRRPLAVRRHSREIHDAELAGGKECRQTPAGLAARANHELDADQAHRLEAHLDSCLRCQATELRIARAERAFATMAGGGITLESLCPAVRSAAPPALVTQSLMLPAGSDAAIASKRTRRPWRIATLGLGTAVLVVAAVVLVAGSGGKAQRSTVRPSATRSTPAPSPNVPAVIPTTPSTAARSLIPATPRKATRRRVVARHSADKAVKEAYNKTRSSAATLISVASASAPVATPPNSSARRTLPTRTAPIRRSARSPGNVVVILHPPSLPAKPAPTQKISSGVPSR